MSLKVEQALRQVDQAKFHGARLVPSSALDGYSRGWQGSAKMEIRVPASV